MNHNESIDFLIKSLQTQASVNQNLITRLGKLEISVKSNEYIIYMLFVVIGLIVGFIVFK